MLIISERVASLHQISDVYFPVDTRKKSIKYNMTIINIVNTYRNNPLHSRKPSANELAAYFKFLMGNMEEKR